MPTTMAELAEAKRNLERCDVIGLTEDFDRSMERLARRLGWPSFGPAPFLNASTVKRADADVPPKAIEILVEWNALDRALDAHALRLIAERGERAGPAPHAPLPRPEGYRFDQPIHGVGWHERETDALGWFCWTGRDEESVLYLGAAANTAAHRLTVRIAHVIHPDALRGMRLTVNGEALPFHTRHEGPSPVVEAEVPGPILAASPAWVRLAIRPGARRRRCDLTRTSSDTRFLGLALRQIDLTPI